ncbi:uncharacterized protein LOC111672974 [Seriola lalandi dorsalis]|uniref:uncharacterized protein LOC111672974 n=1 Tax=Seriola lalandi dorsalis TaxID=1841481 RepID=UPI000C6F7AF4|nr:uncharacterized protein LOC111672974 [Seriola lalandi dorsalis]
MDPFVTVQAGTSPNRSQGVEKPRRVKGWFFFFFLLLGGLGQGARQGNPGDPEHDMRNIDSVTDFVPHMERCSLQCVPNELMNKTTRENDTTVMRQHEKDNSESSEQHARRGLTQTKREVDPIAFDVYPNFYAKGKRGWAALTTELAQLSPKLMKVQSNPHTPLAETPESQKKRMEERLCSDSYEEVSQRKDNFVNFQQSFSEVYRVRNLLKLGESVCEVIVEDVGQGTGFVLFDNFILTNAHLFKGHVDEAKLQVDVDVWIRFNYDEPDPYLLNLNLFSCKKTFIDFDVVQDYAILELNLEDQNLNKNTEAEEIKVPPGLLRNFGLVPLDGKAYIIGHPAGGVKKMDVTHIIEEEDRVQAVNDHLRPYKDHLFTVHSIIQVITDQGIEHVLSGGVLAEKVVTYKTLMYRGSSGSPVFDAFGRVFGLHSLIFAYNFGDQPHIVMGCAYPLHIMFKQFVIKLKESGNYELLSRVEEEAKGNKFLEMISPPTPYNEYFRVRRYSSDYTSKVCEDSEGKEDC